MNAKNTNRRTILLAAASATALSGALVSETVFAETTDSETVKNVKEWNDRAKELASSAKDLAEIAEAAQAMEKLGAAAGALGVFSVGLDIALSFMDTGPTDTELILGAIHDLSTKVDGLWGSIDTQLRDAEFQADWNLARAQIHPVFIDAKELNFQLAKYHDAIRYRNADTAGEARDSLLANYDDVALHKMMYELTSQAEGSLTTQSILEASFHYKHGDLTELKTISLQMIQTYKVVLTALGLWHQFSYERRHPGAEMPAHTRRELVGEIQRNFNPGLQKVIATMNHWIGRCTNEFSSLLSQKVDSVMTQTSVNPGDNGESATDAIYTQISDQFFWFNFAVVVYKPVSDAHGSIWMNQAYTGVNYLKRLDATWAGGTKASMFVYHRAKTHASVTYTPYYTNAYQRHARLAWNNPQDMVKDANKHSPWLGQNGFLLYIADTSWWHTEWNTAINPGIEKNSGGGRFHVLYFG